MERLRASKRDSKKRSEFSRERASNGALPQIIASIDRSESRRCERKAGARRESERLIAELASGRIAEERSDERRVIGRGHVLAQHLKASIARR